MSDSKKKLIPYEFLISPDLSDSGVGATLAVARNTHKIRVGASPTPTIII